MINVNDDYKLRKLEQRAATDPVPRRHSDEFLKIADITIAPVCMRRSKSDTRGVKKRRINRYQPMSRQNLEPRNFQLVSRLNAINVQVPAREIMSKMPFYDAPYSSVYGTQQTNDQLTAMKLKITDMGFTTEQALVGLILTDAIGVSHAVNSITDFPDIPMQHQYTPRNSQTGNNVKERHTSLALYIDVQGSSWPWNVPDQRLCALCGLPDELFHEGQCDVSTLLGQHKPWEEKQPEKSSIDTNQLLTLPRGTTVDEIIARDALSWTPDPLQRLEDIEVVVASAGCGSEPLNDYLAIEIKEIKGYEVPEVITCGICFDEKENDKIFLAPCQHYYCKSCLRMHYRVKILDGDVLRLPCPYINDANEQCEREIEEEEILTFCDEEMKAKFRKFKASKLIQLNEKARFCPKPGCEGWAVGSKWKPKLICDDCSYTYCWHCTNDWHGYFSRCVQTHDGAFIKFTLGKDIQSCPRCHVRIWKNDGCNHMTCQFCKYEFCWLCRGKYTSNHFEPWNLMGCPGAMYFPSWLRCPGYCPSSINRLMIFLCFVGVLTPIAIAFISAVFASYVSMFFIWIAVWLAVCIPASAYKREFITPCSCRKIVLG